jgi:anti-anti-sigma factor
VPEARVRARDFALEIERLAPGTAVLVLAGELDLYRAPEIKDALGALIGEPGEIGPSFGEEIRRLVVDLRSVTFLDSTTLGLLLVASRRQRSCDRELQVLVGPNTPMTAFEATGFDRLLAVTLVAGDLTGAAA